jgi:ankyrin repeat protein
VRQLLVVIFVVVSIGRATAQPSAKVEFARDVQPLFNAHCVECHGPQQQKNGFRLDRRRDAMRGGTSTMIGPGNAEASRLYLKLISDHYGPQMPPGAPLAQEEIDVIKAWIDQGAPWPDELAGESPPRPADPRATRLMAELRDGNREAFERMLREEPATARLTGPGGSTPLMYAALYGDAETVRMVLDAGADPNVQNDAGATALMWAVDDLEKTTLLLKRGADVNALSEDGRTPLLIATGYHGAGEVVKLLLEHGADPSVKAPSYRGPISPLRQAAELGDDVVLRLLLERGADVKGAGPFPLAGALNARSRACVDMLLGSTNPEAVRMAILFVSPPFGDMHALADRGTVKLLIERGADVMARDGAGRTALMLAAHCDSLPLDSISALLEGGAEVNAKTADGKTALDFARMRGNTPVLDLLIKAGAKSDSKSSKPAAKPDPARSARAAVERSLPLLQRADAAFLERTGCVSCHHNTLTAMTVAAARKNGLDVDEETAGSQLKKTASYLENWRERALQDVGIPGEPDTVSYVLLGLAAENHAPDAATDAMARFLKSRQLPDGHWRLLAHRPPIESSEIEVTAVSMRALQVYAPKARRSQYESAVRRAAQWLVRARPANTEDRAFQLLGLKWSGADEATIREAASDLRSQQHPDGGWSQLPTLESDAYATGQALVALNEGAGLERNDLAYQRGVQFLLNTQLKDGSWYVQSRAIAFQPYFESGFPHGHDQWISAAATNWAVMALAPAAR